MLFTIFRAISKALIPSSKFTYGSLSYKKLVDRIVLIAGDSDFVPAAKIARREGIDFVLNPLKQKIKDDLFEHIDGLYNHFPKINDFNKISLRKK